MTESSRESRLTTPLIFVRPWSSNASDASMFPSPSGGSLAVRINGRHAGLDYRTVRLDGGGHVGRLADVGTDTRDDDGERGEQSHHHDFDVGPAIGAQQRMVHSLSPFDPRTAAGSGSIEPESPRAVRGH